MNKRSDTGRRALAVMATLSLAACGGGDAGGTGATDISATTAAPVTAPASAAAPVAPPAPAPSPPPAQNTATSAGATCNLPDFSVTALARLNQRRAAGASCRTAGTFGPAPALTWSTLLTRAAEAHSRDMVARNVFSHTGSGGSTLSSRVNATGFAWRNLGENIAAGYPGVDSVIDGWMASDGHCANIMNPAFDQVGLACVPGNDANDFASYWTLDLARAR